MSDEAKDILDDLDRLGVRCWADGGQIIIEPADRVPGDLKARLREHKPAVLDALSPDWHKQAFRLLNQIDDADAKSDMTDVFLERSAICTELGGCHRAEAGMIAFGELVARMILRGLPVHCNVNQHQPSSEGN